MKMAIAKMVMTTAGNLRLLNNPQYPRLLAKVTRDLILDLILDLTLDLTLDLRLGED